MDDFWLTLAAVTVGFIFLLYVLRVIITCNKKTKKGK